MALPVMDMGAAIPRLHAALQRESRELPLLVGWGPGMIVAAVGSPYRVRVGMPHLKIRLVRGMTPAEIEAEITRAVVELQVSLPPALARAAQMRERGVRMRPSKPRGWSA